MKHAESAISKGNVQWECMKKLQVAYHGCKPLQINTILDKNGNTLSNLSDVCARWKRHFLNVLNVPSNFQEDYVNSVLQLPVRSHLDVPSYGEIQSALGCLKCRKAAGQSGILPELLMSGGPVIGDKLVELLALVRRDGCVVRGWYIQCSHCAST